ncbi:MAG: 30S ribosomal protein S12 methylthiotransferase accessory factor YcaO [Gammaproteobacteria bacterium]
MTEQTYIKGKDRDLESTIETMLSKLADLGIEIEEVSWLNPVPNVYSVHIRDKACELMFTNGKGATRKACLASALGEYFERLSCNYFFADFYLGEEFSKGEFVHYPDERWFKVEGEAIPEGLLDDDLWAYYDPEQQVKAKHLFDTNSGTDERGICALPYARQRDGEKRWFPVSVIGNIYVSNGMSAGNTKNEARVQSLSEVFERYVKNKIISEGICLPEVPQAVLNRYPKIVEAIKELESHDYHLRIADASLGGQYPVMSVTLMNPRDATVYASFGAHPSFEVALERTVTELLQGRSLYELDDFLPPSMDLEEVADHQNLETHFIDSSGLMAYDFFKSKPDYEFYDWDHDTDNDDEFEYLCKIIHDMGHDIYISDYEHLNVYACRIIVPGMSDIYLVDDIVWNNNNEGALFREDILSLRNLNKIQWQNILDRLDEGGYHDMQRVAEFIGVATDHGTVWSGLRIGELKAMLCLAMGDLEQASEWVDWCLHMDQLTICRLHIYNCLKVLLDIKLDDSREYDDYADGLAKLYGKEYVSICTKILEGAEIFHGLHSPGLSMDGFDNHQALLSCYAKLHKFKQSNWA